ncbi:hypothetical protein [Cytobacillus gottheilii]|uniref:hypothetical protein n=1 Tax=Cytobacillus gottheilii TaxID=859144 RepID=UPI0009BB33A4|nr:hypothetical protein [Cytobacillus gottheilii]
MIRSFQFDGLTVYADDLEHAKTIIREYYENILEERLAKGKETDYNEVYTYFPISEIIEEDIPFIYDYKRKGTDDEIASLPLSRAFKYESYRKKAEKKWEGYPISFWMI